MKIKTKKRIYRITKIVWFIIGGFIFLWTVFWFVKAHTLHDFSVLAATILFAIGLYGVFIFIGITLLFLLIKWIVKKLKKRN